MLVDLIYLDIHLRSVYNFQLVYKAHKHTLTHTQIHTQSHKHTQKHTITNTHVKDI